MKRADALRIVIEWAEGNVESLASMGIMTESVLATIKEARAALMIAKAVQDHIAEEDKNFSD